MEQKQPTIIRNSQSGVGSVSRPANPQPSKTGVNFTIKDTEFLLKMFGKIGTFSGQELTQGSDTLTKVKAIHEELMGRVYAL